ncbi:unnamed protein product [Rhizoctonia solani]|uniref:Uncharacterized protein n=1 Tax=Rhizoctonia solani TaxID=456999 RepID=A0A8H2XNW4_9AGAM|nr:unnamed protein product [Rhizoctonia solani]
MNRRPRQPPATKHRPDWGPPLSEYMPTFENRLTESFDKFITNQESISEALNDLIPLNLLETTLAVGENMHKVGFQHGDKVFPVLLSTIRKYTNLHKGGIFDYYYGFLCIRHLIRMVCIGAMRQCKRLDKFLNNIGSDAPWQEVTEDLAASTLESMITVLCSENAAVVENLLGMLSRSGHAFVVDGGLSHEDVEFLIQTLWKDRKSLISLRVCGLLPGLPAMLFVLSEMTVLSKNSVIKRPWLALEDLIFRCYIGDTNNPEREILRQLCVYIESFVLSRYHAISIDYVPADKEDPRIVAEAYCAVFTPPMELSLAPIIQLDIATMLFRWVLELLGWKKGPLAGEDLVPHIIKSAMARLTLEIDREWSGPMLKQSRAFTNRYASEVFGYTSSLVINEQVLTSNVQKALMEMFMEFDFHGLAGRVLMLVTRETSLEPPSFDELYMSCRQMNKAFIILPTPPPEQLASIALVWRKVFLVLMHHQQSSLTHAPRELIGEAIEAWDLLRPPSVKRPPDLFECTNPRHWSLGTSDSHRLKCQ